MRCPEMPRSTATQCMQCEQTLTPFKVCELSTCPSPVRWKRHYTSEQGSWSLQTSPPPRSKTTRRDTQLNRLVPAAGESISLRQGMTSRLSLPNAAEPLYMHHCVKIWRHPQNRKLRCRQTRTGVKVITLSYVTVSSSNLRFFRHIARSSLKAPSTPATMSQQHCRMVQVERFFRQCRMLLRHCCWCGRGLMKTIAMQLTSSNDWSSGRE